MAIDKEIIGMLVEMIATATNMTETEVIAEVKRRAAAARKRIAVKNAKYQVGIDRITDKQALRVTQFSAKGFAFNSLYQNRNSGNVAVMLYKEQVYNPMTQKVGGKTMMVYPDGHTNEEYGSKCKIEPTF